MPEVVTALASLIWRKPRPNVRAFPSSMFAQAAQIVVATLGGLAFHSIGLPAAWLSGSMVAVVIWGALGLARPMPRPLTDAAMVVSGATMGAGITPEAIAAVSRYPASLAMLVVAVVVGTGASALWLIRISGFRRDDALLASVPGALSTVLVIAAERRANVTAIAVVQSIRLFVLVALLPSVVVFLGGLPGTLLPGEGWPVATPLGFTTVLLGGLALGLIFERLRITAPLLLGAAAVSALLHATGSAPGVVPPAVAVGGLVLIGVFIGERFRTLELAALRRLVPAALGSLVTSTAITMLLAGAAALLAEVNVPDAMVAFAPGGLEAMMMLALILGLDPLYVGVHHMARFLGISFTLPFIVGLLGPEPPGFGSSGGRG